MVTEIEDGLTLVTSGTLTIPVQDHYNYISASISIDLLPYLRDPSYRYSLRVTQSGTLSVRNLYDAVRLSLYCDYTLPNGDTFSSSTSLVTLYCRRYAPFTSAHVAPTTTVISQGSTYGDYSTGDQNSLIEYITSYSIEYYSTGNGFPVTSALTLPIQLLRRPVT